MWALVDAVKNVGVPGDMVFDLIIELSDLPNKTEIKQRWQQRLEAQQQQQQAQLQLEMLKQQDRRLNQNISFKDAPLPIQLAMAAQQGLIDPQIPQYVIQLYIQQMFPQLAQQMAQNAQQTAIQQQAAMQQQAALQLAQIQQQQTQPQPQQTPAMTAPAMQSLLAGQGPAL